MKSIQKNLTRIYAHPDSGLQKIRLPPMHNSATTLNISGPLSQKWPNTVLISSEMRFTAYRGQGRDGRQKTSAEGLETDRSSSHHSPTASNCNPLPWKTDFKIVKGDWLGPFKKFQSSRIQIGEMVIYTLTGNYSESTDFRFLDKSKNSNYRPTTLRYKPGRPFNSWIAYYTQNLFIYVRNGGNLNGFVYSCSSIWHMWQLTKTIYNSYV